VYGLLKTLSDYADLVEPIFKVLALLLGSSWVLYLYFTGRSGETGLLIEVVPKTVSAKETLRVVFLDVMPPPPAPCRVDASRTHPGELAPKFDKSINYAGSLKIRRIQVRVDARPSHVDWWGDDNPSIGAETVSEINLLDEYTADEEIPPDFFMEPGEEYHLGACVLLPAGMYLAKVVFVGGRNREFWSRIVSFCVE
jgi:hypothetical protein